MATPAQAAGPVVTGGLINVTIVDAVDIEDVIAVVQVPVAAAVNICDTNVIAVEQGTATECTAFADSEANSNPRNN